MTTPRTYKVEASFDGEYWTQKNIGIPTLFKALDILMEFKRMNGALDYRIVRVEEEVVYEG